MPSHLKPNWFTQDLMIAQFQVKPFMQEAIGQVMMTILKVTLGVEKGSYQQHSISVPLLPTGILAIVMGRVLECHLALDGYGVMPESGQM